MLCIFFGDLDSSTIINGILFFSLSLFSQDKIVPRTISGSRIFPLDYDKWSSECILNITLDLRSQEWFRMRHFLQHKSEKDAKNPRFWKAGFWYLFFFVKSKWTQTSNFTVNNELGFFFRETEGVTKNRCVFTNFWKLLQKGKNSVEKYGLCILKLYGLKNRFFG